MPLTEEEYFGTEENGGLNRDYCIYCYRDGAYTSDVNMQGMIDHCLQYLDEFNQSSGQNLTAEEARKQMLEYFPTLKRWQV